EPLELFTRNLDLQDMVGVPTLDYVDIVGPYNASGSGSTASRDKVFTCYPASAAESDTCAREILGTLGRRAFRRPLDEKDLNLLLSFYEEGSAPRTSAAISQDGNGQHDFERGIQTALRFLLTSPEFLFRSEPDPQGVQPGDVYALDDIALASRLSFFLWSSIPDDELLALAEQNKLSDEATLDAQIERMLRDPKAVALVDNFVAQWLFLRNLRSINPDTRTFPNFDDKLRQAFRTETEMFAQSIIRDDKSVVDFLDADYTYVNDRLAQHYGIPNIYGSHFRRVTLEDESRRGLLGHGSVLTVTSYPNRTSPVLRGKWLLENIIGAPAPPPPPNVPDLPENEIGGVALSVRERLEQHREDPNCRGCHAVMDPLGFSLESFDGIGRYRVRDAAGPIDSAGELADGTPVNGVNDLRRALLEEPEVFVDTVSEKLLTYALGRGLTHKDMPVVRAITRNAADDDYRFSALVKEIVRSTPFRMKRAEGQAISLAKE
ncbi:MAG: DUF1592 domain-containing protein, partial [Pseudomonadota bacterium]|nr:DUF1592 domain-containing protein [Pseudomonadota bacterium]